MFGIFNSMEKEFDLTMQVTNRILRLERALEEVADYERPAIESAIDCLKAAKDTHDVRQLKNALRDTEDF